jgi:hypothetical protein
MLKVLISVIQCVKKGVSEAYTKVVIYLVYWRHNIGSGILQLLQKPAETGRQSDIHLDTSNYIPSYPFRIRIKSELNKIEQSVQPDIV